MATEIVLERKENTMQLEQPQLDGRSPSIGGVARMRKVRTKRKLWKKTKDGQDCPIFRGEREKVWTIKRTYFISIQGYLNRYKEEQ